MLSKVASEAPTLVPASTSFKSVVISMVPRAILVGDTKSLEERGLSGFHTSVTSWDVDIGGSNGTSSGGSSDRVGQNLVTDGLEVIIGEDETDVTLDEWEESFVLRVIGNETLNGTANLVVLELYDSCDQFILSPWYSFPSRQHPRHGESVGFRASNQIISRRSYFRL